MPTLTGWDAATGASELIAGDCAPHLADENESGRGDSGVPVEDGVAIYGSAVRENRRKSYLREVDSVVIEGVNDLRRRTQPVQLGLRRATPTPDVRPEFAVRRHRSNESRQGQ